MTDTFSKDYNDIIQLENAIKSDIKIRKAMDNKDANTFKVWLLYLKQTEEKIRKALENFKKQQSVLNTTYTSKYSNKGSVNLPEKEINRRINQILELENHYNEMKSTYDSILDNKYKYQGDPNKLNFNNYQESEEQKKMSTGESLNLYKSKLKSIF